MKRLIVFYSYTNHTRMIAKRIQEKLNCDIVEIEGVVPYSSNYQEVVDEEERNMELKSTPKIKPLNVNINDYDEIILGTPVWWYTMVPVVRTFLKEYNLTGKVVVPFCTNAGWLGDTFKEIHSLTKNATIKNEMSIVFSTDYKENKLKTSLSEIDKWIESL